MDFTFPTYESTELPGVAGVPPKDMLRLFRRDANRWLGPSEVPHSVPTVVLGNRALQRRGLRHGRTTRRSRRGRDGLFRRRGFESRRCVGVLRVGGVIKHADRLFLSEQTSGGISTPMSIQSKIPALSSRPRFLDSRAFASTANDVLRVYEVTKRALENARVGGRPDLELTAYPTV